MNNDNVKLDPDDQAMDAILKRIALQCQRSEDNEDAYSMAQLLLQKDTPVATTPTASESERRRIIQPQSWVLIATAAAVLIGIVTVPPMLIAKDRQYDISFAGDKVAAEERARQEVLGKVQLETERRQREATRKKLAAEVSRRMSMYLTFARNPPLAAEQGRVHRDVLIFESMSKTGHFFGAFSEFAQQSTCQLIAALGATCDGVQRDMVDRIQVEIDGIIGRHYAFGSMEGAVAFEEDIKNTLPKLLESLKELR
jgi:hypothetical protein